ncbi:MAG: extracellular solute-binding protein [Fervidobacterium sp.]|nr:extracellular solute-binding protein [Fervidobacterium sp.]NLH37818.1 extracellular solute-binding protein [Thermotogaceae bacterium]MBP9518618.1 extracellular solute-binding protein [Fervidobacterium sp.]HOH53935.1 extracellular solute-binding protein [Fervidobacterium sp.]HPT53582.1 extracellular solute-binding protein [Fervidobacterium sp.]
MKRIGKMLVIFFILTGVLALAADVVTIKYANWNLGTPEENNVERQMIQAFMDTHPNIKVVIDDSIKGDWNASLAAAAAAGTMPDVFMLTTVPDALANGWLYDLTKTVATDPDWSKIPSNITSTIKYNGKVSAIPFAMHFMGYFMNKDIFTSENIAPLKFNYTTTQFKNAVLRLTKHSKGIVGLSEEIQVFEWYPASVSFKFGFYTFDGKKFNLDSQEFIDGFNLAKSFVKAGAVYSALTDEQKTAIAGSPSADGWATGHIALNYNGTWMVPDYKKNLSFAWDFVGIPGGRTILVLDYLGISKSTKHIKEAYEFAKWMSFSKQGYLKRLELAKKSNTILTTPPLMNDAELVDKYQANVDVPGLKEAYRNIGRAIVEGFKFVPGYAQARWNAPTGIKIGDKVNASIGDVLWNGTKMDLKIEDIAKQLNDLANQKYQEALKAIK